MDSAHETDQPELDGGSLLYRLTWNQGDAYDPIAKAYASITTRKCGTAIMVDLIDHRPRTTPTNAARKRMRYPELRMQGRTVIHRNKGSVLEHNPKQEAMIRLISDKLCQNGFKVVQASGDADIDSVEAAVSSSLTKSTTLMERIHITYLLVFLLFHS